MSTEGGGPNQPKVTGEQNQNAQKANEIAKETVVASRKNN